jgi:hypothetical protein
VLDESPAVVVADAPVLVDVRVLVDVLVADPIEAFASTNLPAPGDVVAVPVVLEVPVVPVEVVDVDA